MGCWSILDAAKVVLEAEGVRGVGSMSKEQVAQRALHSTSDFPEILANVAPSKNGVFLWPVTLAAVNMPTLLSEFQDNQTSPPALYL